MTMRGPKHAIPYFGVPFSLALTILPKRIKSRTMLKATTNMAKTAKFATHLTRRNC